MALIALMDFEDQTAGSPVTVASPWSIGGTAPVATTAAAVHGNLGASLDGDSFGVVICGGLTAGTTTVVDFYIIPRANSTNSLIGQKRATGGVAAQLRWAGSGVLSLRDKYAVTATSTVALAIDTTYRLSWRTGSGAQELRIYEGESATPLETISGTLTEGAITDVQIGAVTSAAGTLFDVDTIRVADDWLEPVNPVVETHTHFYVSGGQLVPLMVKAAAATVDPPVVAFAAAEGNAGNNPLAAAQTLDAGLASAVGESTPFMEARHVYSGNSFPAFNSTDAKLDVDNGWPISILNVKTDWTELADGDWDAHITQFSADIPSGHTVYLIINHEPENDSDPGGAAAWRAGQARAANLIETLDNPHLHFAVCHMTWTWKPASGRNPEDWNPTAGMTQAALDRTILAPDGYTDILDATGTSWQSMQSEFDPVWAAGRAWGFTRFGISEHALRNRDYAPNTAVADIWTNDYFPYIESLGLVYYAVWSSAAVEGVNQWIDSPEEYAAFAAWMKQLKETP